jgi:hypothetical protein
MNKLLKVLIAGTVINFIAVPFFYSQNLSDFNWSLGQSQKNRYQKHSLNSFRLSRNTIIIDKQKDSAFTKDSSFAGDSTFTSKQVIDKKFKMKKKPWVAVLLSAVLPGAGQFYNRSYWKIPVVLGLAGYFGYEYWREDKNYRDYRDRYSASQTPENPEGDGNLKTLREFYRSQRGDFTWYFIIVYFVNLVDAYIDAHLFDFDVRDEKIRAPGMQGKTFSLGIHLPLK